jgi:V/A-type H+-transporting ATPase subunit F
VKYFLISDNIDTLAGMRMVGVAGVVVHTGEELQAAIEKAAGDDEVGLVLVTSKLFKEHSGMLFHYKLHRRKPLIVEMPDRHSGDNVAGGIKQYIAEAVGIKI